MLILSRFTSILINYFTAFLPADVSELKRINVDINPEYSDSLDMDTFAMHLMFEPAEPGGRRTPEKTLPTVLDPLYTFPARGKDAFEAGLDEVRYRCLFILPYIYLFY